MLYIGGPPGPGMQELPPIFGAIALYVFGDVDQDVARAKLRQIALVASVPELLHARSSVAIDRRGFESQLPEVASLAGPSRLRDSIGRPTAIPSVRPPPWLRGACHHGPRDRQHVAAAALPPAPPGGLPHQCAYDCSPNATAMTEGPARRIAG